MAKKYLLYIHDPRFDKEQKKSLLVNRLLLKHYGGEKVDPSGDGGATPAASTKPIKTPKDIKPILDDLILCKHQAAKGFCKNSKCEHSMFNPKNK